jgi:hypothetical protein
MLWLAGALFSRWLSRKKPGGSAMFKVLKGLPWNGILKFLTGLLGGASLPTLAAQALPVVAQAIPSGSTVATVVHAITTVGGAIVGIAATLESAAGLQAAANTTRGLPDLPPLPPPTN